MRSEIFKNAKFGDKFLTRCGDIVLYVGYHYDNARIYIEGEGERIYNGKNGEYQEGKGHPFDIVARADGWNKVSDCLPSAEPYKSQSAQVLVLDDGEMRIDRYDWDKDGWDDLEDDVEYITHWKEIEKPKV